MESRIAQQEGLRGNRGGTMITGLIFWLSVLTVFYSYFGYPLLVSLFSILFPKPPRLDPRYSPGITLLIAAYNEERFIGRKLDNSLDLDYPPSKLQILVTADGSDDGTARIVDGYADRGVELLHQPERAGKMAAINRALPRAGGEIIVFSDANNMYERGVLRELAAPFADPTVGAVTGAKRIARDGSALGSSEGFYWKYESFIKGRESLFGSCTAVAGEILALRRELYRPPPDRVINDDFYLAMDVARRGYRVVYAPSALSTESVSANPQEEIVRRTRIVAGRYQAMALSARLLTWRRPVLAWQIVSHKFLRPLVPFAMIGALLSNLVLVIHPPRDPGFPILNLQSPAAAIALALQILFYVTALAGNLPGLKGLPVKFLYLPTFLVNSNLAALLGLYGYVTGRNTALWKRAERGTPGGRESAGDLHES